MKHLLKKGSSDCSHDITVLPKTTDMSADDLPVFAKEIIISKFEKERMTAARERQRLPLHFYIYR